MAAPVFAGTPEPASFSSDQGLTAQEFEQARLFLQQTQNAVLGATKGLSDAQWRFKPAPDRWSIAENLDHIVSVQERVLGPILGQLANAPAPPAARELEQADAIVIHHFPTRLNKFPAPQFVQPADQIMPLELLERLKRNCRRLVNCLQTTHGLRQHAVEAAPMKAVSKGAHELMDGYQWILAAAAHTERHAKQILEVKADDDFPVG
jgi:DinB superfamily